MNKKVIILVALIIGVSAIGLPLYLINNQNNENPDLQVTLKSCEYKSHDVNSGWILFTVIFQVEPIGFSDRNQFQISYANITDGNERNYGVFQPIRNNTAEGYTYWRDF